MYKHKTANDIKMLHTWLRTHDFPRGLFRNEFSGLPAFRRNGDIFLALGFAGVDCGGGGGGGVSSAMIPDVDAKKSKVEEYILPLLTHTWKANEAEMLSNIHEHS